MTPHEELERIKKDFAPYWATLEQNPEFKKALKEMKLVELAEIAHREVRGNYSTPSMAKKMKDYY